MQKKKSVHDHFLDKEHLNLRDPRNAEFWTRELAVSEERLRLMVRMFGNSPALIRRALAKGSGRSANGTSTTNTATGLTHRHTDRKAS
jgi:hypothetical protein